MRDFDPCASEFISSGYSAHSRPGGRLYDPASIISVGANLVGGMMGADAAGDAADAQARAAAQSDATQRYFYDTTRADNAPFRDAGVAANNRLAQLMGLNVGAPSLTPEQLRSELLSQFSTTNSTPGTYRPIMQSEDYQPAFMPMAGGGALTTTVDEAGLKAAIDKRLADQAKAQAAMQADPAFGSLTRNFSAQDLEKDAVYQSGLKFGLDQGVAGINRQAAAGGNFLSGATLKALTRFGNDYGSTKANESYNRFNNNQTQQYNRLAGLSGAGQQATNQVSAAGQNAGNQISASQQGAGNARASGYVGQANAWNSALGQGVNAFQQNRLMNNLFPSGGRTGGGFSTDQIASANAWNVPQYAQPLDF